MIPTPEKTIFSVSQLNRQAKHLLETHLPMIWVSGELSNLAKPSSGHWYFSLKDERAQVRCAMFKNANQRLRQAPTSGQQVLIRARVSLYEGRGEYQLIAEHMEPAGAGALQQAYEALKLKLQQQGLFDPERKQALPAAPRQIGVITSPTGAAIHDILSVLARRYPLAHITVIPAAVQGESAPGEMIQALKKAQAFGQFELLIIGRGGGSIEDLWAFNDEALARAIAACPIPTISAVGHEVDFTICDFVADVRAATPSASAELATPDIAEWQQNLDLWQQQLHRRQQVLLHKKQQQLQHLQKRLRHPGESIKFQQQQLAHIHKALGAAIGHRLAQQQQALEQQRYRLQQQHPQRLLAQGHDRLGQLHTRLRQSMERTLQQGQQRLSTSAQLLHAVSPLQVLSRGYSIVTGQDQSVITHSQDIQAGDQLTTQLGSGTFTSQVLSVEHAPTKHAPTKHAPTQ